MGFGGGGKYESVPEVHIFIKCMQLDKKLELGSESHCRPRGCTDVSGGRRCNNVLVLAWCEMILTERDGIV